MNKEERFKSFKKNLEEEESLSEKEVGNPKALDEPVCKSKDIQEAVRKLKEELKHNPLHPLAIVDKIFGEKLV